MARILDETVRPHSARNAIAMLYRAHVREQRRSGLLMAWTVLWR